MGRPTLERISEEKKSPFVMSHNDDDTLFTDFLLFSFLLSLKASLKVRGEANRDHKTPYFGGCCLFSLSAFAG
jgi:hypothetical protein